MRARSGRVRSSISPRPVRALLAVVAVSSTACLSIAAPWAELSATVARHHYPCSGPKSAHVPCYFSTPSGNIHCKWTPASKSVTCELLATRRAYLLRPEGKAKAVRIELTRRGETLPTSHFQLVFPQKLSCEDRTPP